MRSNHLAGLFNRIALILPGVALLLVLATSGAYSASGDDVVARPPADQTNSATPELVPGTWQHQYWTARKLIDAKEYQAAINALTAIERPDNVEILNLLGFTNRKLGRMEQAQGYYEAALAIDPKHLGVLEYYGEWFVSSGDMDRARAHLAKIGTICGTDCREYKLLEQRIAHPDKEPEETW